MHILVAGFVLSLYNILLNYSQRQNQIDGVTKPTTVVRKITLAIILLKIGSYKIL